MTGKVRVRGGWTCSCVATSLPLVEAEMLARNLISHNIDVFQYGYRGDVSASAGTHAGGGCTGLRLPPRTRLAVRVPPPVISGTSAGRAMAQATKRPRQQGRGPGPLAHRRLANRHRTEGG